MPKIKSLKQFIIIAISILVGLFVFCLIFISKSLSLKQITYGNRTQVVYVGSKKYQDTFSKSLEKAEIFFNPFREAAEYMEKGNYDAALKNLDECLKVAQRRIEKGMVYSMMQQVYRKQGNLQGELQVIDSWFTIAGPSASNPEFKHRAEEIRQILAKQQK